MPAACLLAQGGAGDIRVDQAWSDSHHRAEASAIATQAAKEDARRAIAGGLRDLIMPLQMQITAHVSEDNAPVDALRDDVSQLKTAAWGTGSADIP